MTITAIILSHYEERQDNLKRMIDDLLDGSVKPEEIVVFIDNPEIDFKDERATIIKSSKSFLPKIRFSLGTYFDTDYCFFIDDDLSVRKETLVNFVEQAKHLPNSILGYEGSILDHGSDNPYADDTPIDRGGDLRIVDVIIRTYFVPTHILSYGLQLQHKHPDQPRLSLDDVYLCFGNEYLNDGDNVVIPVTEESDLDELDEAGVGQSKAGIHYENRNKVCRYLLDQYIT